MRKPDRPTLRCAIYTRKSTEEGLEQAFNSLDAQREACAAYILSQTHEGWEAVAEHYDDGGWSGGTMDRPALRQLLDDVRSRKIDIIVVYKVDRLTRSLSDFARIVETLDAHHASFVSVTQAFNTTNSMGRLTLNVLLSFAQFEREVTAERIRDKIAASKARGMWMGGPVPIGYRLENHMLVPEPEEAATVRLIFERYAELRSMGTLVDELNDRGVRTKLRPRRDGSTVGGIPFSKGPLAQLLQNPVYIGKVRHRDLVHEGQHASIVDPDLFAKVQDIIEANRRDHKLGRRGRQPSLLTAMLSDPDSQPMSPSHACRGTRRYRYYQTRVPTGAPRDQLWRLPAGEIERVVIAAVADHLGKSPMDTSQRSGADIAASIDARNELARRLPTMPTSEQRAELLLLKTQVDLLAASVRISLGAEQALIELPAKLVKRGSDVRLVIEEHRTATPDPVLRRLVAQAFAARDYLFTGTLHPCIREYSRRYLAQLARIAWLAPDIICAILDGTQPPQLTGRRLTRANAIPLDWPSQRVLFGFA